MGFVRAGSGLRQEDWQQREDEQDPSQVEAPLK